MVHSCSLDIEGHSTACLYSCLILFWDQESVEHGGLKAAFVLCKCRKQQSHAPHSVITALHIKKQLVPVYDEVNKKS